MPTTIFKPHDERSDVAKIIIGFATTALIAVATKIITLAMASQTAADIAAFLSENFGFWIQTITTAGAGGYFAQKWSGGK